MAMATPGSTSPTSRRAIAIEPAKPVATAAARSVRVGETRPTTWELVRTFVGLGRIRAMRKPIATTAATLTAT
jgi:hypothetical protein